MRAEIEEFLAAKKLGNKQEIERELVTADKDIEVGGKTVLQFRENP